MKTCVVLAMVASVWVGALWAVPPAQPQNAATIDYQQQVHTILAAKCLSCHSAERRSGGLSLAAYMDALEGGRSGAAVRPGDSAGSLLVKRITGEVTPPMPFGRPALSAGEIAAIRLWIDEGARETIASAAAKPKWEAPLAPDAHTSTSGVCCRRRTIFTRLSQTGPRTSDPHSSSVSLPTMTSTPS